MAGPRPAAGLLLRELNGRVHVLRWGDGDAGIPFPNTGALRLSAGGCERRAHLSPVIGRCYGVAAS